MHTLAPLELSDEFYRLMGEGLVYLGIAVLVLLAVIIVVALFTAALMAYSFRRDRYYLPRFILWSISVMGGIIKAVFTFFRMDPESVDRVAVELKNRVMLERFYATPPERRMILLPQCLRSVECPAPLTPEGIACVNCGRCPIGRAKQRAEELGYRVFILPGSSAIKRLIRKYEPEAILGVGCIMEVREGLELCHGAGLTAVGLLLQRDGCVATTLDWDAFYALIDPARHGGEKQGAT
ncbi:MAG: uncharacterized protein PWR26_236 [Methanosarcinales archaeon]|uniref:DUF116 domain-containing protein n=1 Tax=Methermicoccus shengliensis TaxID=660064 RepID=UPI0005B2BCB0|nr:DUF116 domain-containing protein [Methermicoccus shengliensis]MDI3487519.1 uncharacterized protein [Methanosarcinales archaeon]MDN5295153.1 uncharacterized protein [Methanosarcinales archaeon]